MDHGIYSLSIYLDEDVLDQCSYVYNPDFFDVDRLINEEYSLTKEFLIKFRILLDLLSSTEDWMSKDYLVNRRSQYIEEREDSKGCIQIIFNNDGTFTGFNYPNTLDGVKKTDTREFKLLDTLLTNNPDIFPSELKYLATREEYLENIRNCNRWGKYILDDSIFWCPLTEMYEYYSSRRS